jgi:pyruvate,water dikinase
MSDAELSRLKAIAERQIQGSGFSRFFSGKRLWFRFLLKYARIYSGVLRENEGFYITMMFPQVKRALRAIAAELKQRSVLEEEDDIYYLTFSEICNSAEGLRDTTALAGVIAGRKRVFLGSTVPENEAQEQGPSGNLASGAPASPGRVAGTAIVLSHPGDPFTPGAILVTHTLNSAWVSILRSAAGVVTEVGGMLSHGAVLAREFGVPAVLGAGPITRRIHTGQHVTVDGTKGHVHIDEGAGMKCAS